MLQRKATSATPNKDLDIAARHLTASMALSDFAESSAAVPVDATNTLDSVDISLPIWREPSPDGSLEQDAADEMDFGQAEGPQDSARSLDSPDRSVQQQRPAQAAYPESLDVPASAPPPE